MFKHTIKTNILSIFILLVSIVAISLLSSQYYFNYNLAIASTDKTFKLISKNTLKQVKEDGDNIHNILKTNINNQNLFHDITSSYYHKALEDLTQIININNGIYAIYLTHKDGSFYQVINMEESSKLYDLFQAPKQTRWIVRTNTKEYIKHLYLDENKKLLFSKNISSSYHPKDTNWYKQALNASNSISTSPYVFSSLKRLGMTFAIELKKEGSVLAIDYTMKEIGRILELQKSEKDSEIFIFNKEGVKLSSSNKDTKAKISPKLLNSFFNSKYESTIKYTQNDKNYFVMYIALKNKNMFLGIQVDADILFKPYIQSTKYAFSIAFLLLLASLPIIYFATNKIVKPIKDLTQENEKIKNREFDKVKHINTNIIEFMELSSSFVSMSKSIQAYQKSQEELLDSIVKLIAEAVDAKSHYTGGHCERVPEIAQMLVHIASESSDGIFKEFSLKTEDELREFEIGAWLHDCGKVTTPEYVVDKSTKLETINNRIHEVRTRFEVLWRDSQIVYLKSQLNSEDKDKALKILHTKQEQLKDDFSFIANANIGGEFMSEDKQQRVKDISSQEWERNFDDSLGLGEVEILRYMNSSSKTLPATEKLLSDKKQHIIKREFFDYVAYKRDGFKEKVPEHLYNYGEIYNLCIAKGTLSTEERYKINEHVILSIKMLEKIPFPSNMTRIPEYAGTHHETLIGTGYPRKLTKNELSIPARIMAIADVFEALTASDRPYKKAKTLSASIKIMSLMVKDEHLDEDIFKLFLKSDLHLSYAQKYLKPEQIDEVDIKEYL